MDSIFKSKRQKPSEVQGMNQAEKRLSDLPDVVLEHILSYLPTKDAVRTRFLSKRWECLWASIPMLNFSENEANRIHLMDIVDHLLSLGSSNIEKFSIVWVWLGDAVRIRRLISTRVWRNVQEFHICPSDCKRLFETPDSPFTYQSFGELELSISHTLKIPPPLCLSTLKILHLENITFLNDDLTQMLFSGCPELEEVILSKCNWVNVNVVSICASKLRSLSISEMEIDNHQWNESDGCQIVIFGNSLKFLKYSGEFLNDYFLYDSSSVDEVRIEMDNARERSRMAAYRLYNLLRGISDVKKLVLSAAAIEVLNHARELLTQMPLFNNLTTLTLNSEPLDLESKALLMIIENSPILNAHEFSEKQPYVSLPAFVERRHSDNINRKAGWIFTYRSVAARFLDPMILGKYPAEMNQILGSDLPAFSKYEMENLKNGLHWHRSLYQYRQYLAYHKSSWNAWARLQLSKFTGGLVMSNKRKGQVACIP